MGDAYDDMDATRLHTWQEMCKQAEAERDAIKDAYIEAAVELALVKRERDNLQRRLDLYENPDDDDSLRDHADTTDRLAAAEAEVVRLTEKQDDIVQRAEAAIARRDARLSALTAAADEVVDLAFRQHDEATTAEQFIGSLFVPMTRLRTAALAAAVQPPDSKPAMPGLHNRPDGQECNYLAVEMPHGGRFCNKCGWASPDSTPPPTRCPICKLYSPCAHVAPVNDTNRNELT